MKTALSLFAVAAAFGLASANTTNPTESLPAPEQAAPAAPEVKDETRTLTLAVGAKEIIKLPCNPSTGYVWIILEGTKSEIVSVEDEVTFPEAQPGQPPLCGAPAETLISITGLKPGKERVLLSYARPWEQPLQPARVITVEVEVTEAPAAN